MGTTSKEAKDWSEGKEIQLIVHKQVVNDKEILLPLAKNECPTSYYP